MEISQNLTKKVSNSFKFPSLSPKNWIMDLVKWYYKKFKPAEARENSPLFYREFVDQNIWIATVQVTRWTFETSITGLIIWYPLFMFINMPIYFFFALGTTAWIVKRIRPRWW